MPYSRDVSTLGNKLGPKLIAAVTQSVIATKKGLMPTEHALRVNAMQTVIDRAGHEVADLHRPLVQEALGLHDNLHPLAQAYLEQISSGQDQWQSLVGGIALGQAAGSLGLIINNSLAPLVQSIVRQSPWLHIDQNTAAQAVARNIITYDDGRADAAEAGYNQPNFDALVALSTAIPPPDILLDLLNRGVVSEPDVIYMLRRNGFSQAVAQQLVNLRKTLLTAADAALAVLRGNITNAEGQRIANQTGVNDSDFALLVENTGEPPGTEQLLEAYRRNFIDRPRLERGIRQSRVRNEWIDVVEALRYSPMSAADAIETNLKGYISEATARSFAQQSGLEPSAFDPLLKAAGEPLSRTEMADLVNRGEATIAEYEAAIRQSRVKDAYIPLSTKLIERPMTGGDAVRGFVQGYLSEAETDRIQGMNGLRAEDRKILREIDGIPLSLTEMLRLYRMGKVDKAQVEQALRESRLKDKYIPVALDLGVNLPSIFEIRLLLRDGALTDAQAAQILKEHGYQQDIITGIIHAFGSSATSASKTITEGMLVDLYLEHAIGRAELLTALEDIGYSKANAALITEVADWRVELQARSAFLSRVRAQYVGRHIDEAAAEAELYRESIPADVIAHVMDEWNAEIKVTVRLLTPAQVVDAWFNNLFDASSTANNTAQAITYLQRLSYGESDAMLLLEIKNNGPLTG